MIARMWRGQAKAADADAYERFVTTKVFAELPAIAGHRGAYLLKRPIENGDEVEFIAVTLWGSLAAIRGFAGEAIERAVVEPEARTLLLSWDERVAHHALRLRVDGCD